MIHNLLEILWVHRIENIEKIFARLSSFCWVTILEVDVEVGIIFKILPKIFDTELIPGWNMDEVDLIFLLQLLLVSEDLSQEVLRDLCLRRHVILDYERVRYRIAFTNDVCLSRCKSQP